MQGSEFNRIQIYGSPFLKSDLRTSMNSNDQHRHLTLSKSGEKQDIDSYVALETFPLK